MQESTHSTDVHNELELEQKMKVVKRASHLVKVHKIEHWMSAVTLSLMAIAFKGMSYSDNLQTLSTPLLVACLLALGVVLIFDAKKIDKTIDSNLKKI